MCGIIGSFSPRSGRQPAGKAWARILPEVLWRRGPDDEGYWDDGRCFLGFRRLAILDLTPSGH